ncbi:hypothetical protein M977_04526 [Buttiauxella gaviniae ATCC 51604]|uniref:Uncharacterized protein n=1 Tax=Buttiauxella gaviniae ATCC 51604 TaxID=1354253 RepID=A0A1B7HMF6_9ENTR|nr:hypothetical protein [Buttiauxella gaviniae]OAT16739.1 hypothetical protein M977_04526 [Buttiauxella gaviniae ATCC 51604]
MKLSEELPATGYAVIRCHDRAVVARFDSFPGVGQNPMPGNAESSLLMYFRDGVPLSGFWLRDDEFVTSLRCLDEGRKKAGLSAIDYRRTKL